VALILNIETGGPTCSVCLSANGILIKERKEVLPNKHAAILTVLIQELLAETGYSLQQIDAVAISKGPGSYTGLRIGTAIAKGLCFTADKPLIAISSLQSLAWKMRHDTGGTNESTFVPLIQARKDAVYYAVFNQKLEEIATESVGTLSEAAEYIKKTNNQPTAGFFNLNDSTTAFFQSFGIVIVYFEYVSSNGCELAFSKFEKDLFEDNFLFEPFYMTGFGKNF
jgi:tRNA threonylcarbamoyladenosine biosynthesis protein TsaB